MNFPDGPTDDRTEPASAGEPDPATGADPAGDTDPGGDGDPVAEADPPAGAAGPRDRPAGTDDEPQGEEPEVGAAALQAIARHGLPPRPPRRTGVFVDPDDLRDHVGELLRAILGGYEVDAFGNFTFAHEGARVFVTVGQSPIGPQVGVFSVTNLDVQLTHDLASFLLTTNHTLGFGAFSYDRDNSSVWLRHTLLGTTLDGPELQSAVAAVATTAARLDDPIRDRFGGRTFAEAPDDMQRGMEPPQAERDPRGPNASGYL